MLTMKTLELANPNDPTIPFDQIDKNAQLQLAVLQAWNIDLCSLVEGTNGQPGVEYVNPDSVAGCSLWTISKKRGLTPQGAARRLKKLQDKERKDRVALLAAAAHSLGDDETRSIFDLVPSPVHIHAGV